MTSVARRGRGNSLRSVDRPIGMFDSGFGGLTVAWFVVAVMRAVKRALTEVSLAELAQPMPLLQPQARFGVEPEPRDIVKP